MTHPIADQARSPFRSLTDAIVCATVRALNRFAAPERDLWDLVISVLPMVPPGVVTVIGPVVAPAGTVAWIAVAEFTVKVALTPLNCTAVTPLKLVPLMVTLVPTRPVIGVKLVMDGGARLAKYSNAPMS